MMKKHYCGCPSLRLRGEPALNSFSGARERWRGGTGKASTSGCITVDGIQRWMCRTSEEPKDATGRVGGDTVLRIRTPGLRRIFQIRFQGCWAGDGRFSPR